jgi:hypothetical protein
LKTMRILFVADGRSPTALNWIHYFVERGDEVHLVSTYPCAPDERLASLTIIPVAFSQAAGGAGQGPNSQAPTRSERSIRMRTLVRQWLGPLTLGKAAASLGERIRQVKPDLVHAMRIPYEGMLAARSQPTAPLLMSVWGNDFTLHAPATPWMGRLTRQALARADALHADCGRDIRLAIEWGLAVDKPTIVLPGAGGVQPEVFYPPGKANEVQPMVINPRGFRAYVRNEIFFKAIPRVLERQPGVRFVCPAMETETQAQHWVTELGIGANVDLLSKQSRPQMAEWFRRSLVAVSLTTHDGTPNTLLEAMACGCFPVVGNLESIREWITPGVNGLLVDVSEPGNVAQAILAALEQPELRRKAQAANARLIAQRAAYGPVMGKAEQFYRQLLDNHSQRI